MWYRGSRGDEENKRRMTGAAVALSVFDVQTTQPFDQLGVLENLL